VSPGLGSIRVLEIGETIAVAAAGAMLSKLGAGVTRLKVSDGATGPLSPRSHPSQRDRLLALLGRGKVVVEVGNVWDDLAFISSEPRDITIVDIGLSGYWRRAGWVGQYERAVSSQNRSSWVTISSFGLHGELTNARGDEVTNSAAGGISFYMRSSRGRPMKPAGFSSSLVAGHFAALAGMHGLLRKHETGSPVHLDLSVQDSVIVTGVFLECSHQLFDCAEEGASKDYAAPVGLVRCSDGLVWIVVLEDHHWAGCVRAMGNPEWAVAITTRAERHARREFISRCLDDWAASLSTRECTSLLQSEGVPATPLNSCADLLSSVGLDVREGFFGAGEQPTELLPGVPVRLTDRAVSKPEVSRTYERAGRPPRVVDISQVLVAPLATSWLGAMGVDVLKIEDPDRMDVYRRVGPFVDRRPDPEASAYFAFANYSKRSYALRLDSREGRDRLQEIMASADVVVANLSRHRAKQVGVTRENLEASGSSVLVTSSGFGATTASADYRAYGLNIQAAGGVVHLSRDRDGEPRNLGTSWADPLTSIWIAATTLMQLLAPLGQRCHADVSMVEVVACQFPEYFSEYTQTGVERTANESRLDHAAPCGIYRCAGTDDWLAISVQTNDDWWALLRAFDSPQVLADPRFETSTGRQAFQDELDVRIEQVTEGLDREEAFSALQQVGVACAPVWRARDLIALPHLHERGLLHVLEHAVWGRRSLVGLPWRIVGEGSIPIGVSPLLGEHNSDDPARWWN